MWYIVVVYVVVYITLVYLKRVCARLDEQSQARAITLRQLHSRKKIALRKEVFTSYCHTVVCLA